MANTKISALTTGTAGALSDEIVIARAGANNKLTLSQLGCQFAISKSGIPFIKLSSGSIGNNGALSGITALPRIYSAGAYVWVPAGAIAAGVPAAASWYWAVFSSTTAATIYNSTYTSGQPVAGTLTAFVTTGPGAFTGDTGTITSVSVSIAAASLGVNGECIVGFGNSFNNTGGNKTFTVKFGSAQMWGTVLTTQGSLAGQAVASNAGVLTAQRMRSFYLLASSAANGSVLASDGAENTANAVTVVFNLTTAVATDHAILESHSVYIAP